jgi:protein TonB
MFETVVPETVAPRSRKVFYETLPISIVAHAIIGGAIVASTIWEIEFPASSPALYAPYQLAAAPPPPPPPPPPARSQVVQQVKMARMPEVAPTIIPDVIPEVLPAVETDSEGMEEGVEGGIAGGYLGGVVGGVIGGILTDDMVVPKVEPPAVLQVARDADLPIDIIDRRYPDYPSLALMRGWEDQLVVRYVIGKDGRVNDVRILEPPEREQFGRAALRRIREWRFRPYRDENGSLKEVVHELTVQFRIISKKAS